MPFVSVIVPVYNSAPTLRRCLESVLGQTFEDYEIVVVDDGSSDDSRLIAQEYQRRHPLTITVLSQSNQGAGAARNLAIGHSRGEYITFLDSDDYFEKDYLEVMSRIAQEQHADLVLCGHERINMATGEVEYRMVPRDCEWAPFKFVAIAGKMCRLDLVKHTKAAFGGLSIGEDILFSVRLLSARPRIGITSYAGYKYTLNPASVSSETFHADGFHSSLDLEKEIVKVFSASDSDMREKASFFVQKLIVYNLYKQRKTTKAELMTQEYKEGIDYLVRQGFRTSMRWQKGEDALVNVLVILTELASRTHCLCFFEKALRAL